MNWQTQKGFHEQFKIKQNYQNQCKLKTVIFHLQLIFKIKKKN